MGIDVRGYGDGNLDSWSDFRLKTVLKKNQIY